MADEISGQTLTAEPAVEYGIWSDIDEDWWVLGTGEVFHTTSPSIAAAQFRHLAKWCQHVVERSQYYVREFTLKDTP